MHDDPAVTDPVTRAIAADKRAWTRWNASRSTNGRHSTKARSEPGVPGF